MNFSFYPMSSSHQYLLAICLCCSVIAQAADTAAPASRWTANYSSSSIKSLESADDALHQASLERARIQERFALEEQGCFDLFFANACRDAASERRRVALSEVRKVEVEANAFKRRARVAERDRILADKRAAQNKQETRADAALIEVAVPLLETLGHPSAGNDNYSDEALKPAAQISAPSVGTTGKIREDRSRQIVAYEKKVKEAEERKREVARRKAEKEAKRLKNRKPDMPQ